MIANNAVDTEVALEEINPVALESLLVQVPEAEWIERGYRRALNQAIAMSISVPAYKIILQEAGLNLLEVNKKALADFPLLDKDSYLRRFTRAQMVWDGSLNGRSWIISTTSGSTGEPFYFPRTSVQDDQYALSAELYLRNNFKIHERSTLYIVAFPMGAWIGGLFTYEAIRRVGERGNYDLSIITPGINKAEVIKAVQNLGHDYDQVIIGSYAPFLKDIIDDGIRAGLNWKDYKLGFVFSAEGFNEEFRNYICAKTGIDDPLTSTLNHYGTVDLGTMAHETPVAILIRRIALTNPKLYQDIFGQATKLPTLAQYIPEQFFFEADGQNLFCSAPSGIPLIRYDLKDHGGIVTLAQMEQKFSDNGLDLRTMAEEAGIETIWNLPFVYVYERSDFSVSFYAFQVYPETIRHVVSADTFAHELTGKFTMTVDFDTKARQKLIINFELKPETENTPEFSARLMEAVMARLLHDNSEFRSTYEEYGDKIRPKLVFWDYEHVTHFMPGTKQKWIKK